MSSPENSTLELRCVDVIIRNFDRFCVAFLSEENWIKFYLEFIQRRWSSLILKKLSERYWLKDKHLQIVINKYSKELDFQTILNCKTEAVISCLKEVGNGIEKVSMKDMAFFYNFDNVWSCLSGVQTIELQHTNCTDQSLYIISNSCPHLKNLNLFDCEKVSDVSISHIIKNKLSLETLNVEETGVTYKGVASTLKSIPSLKKLWHSNVPKAIFEVLGLNDSVGIIPSDITFNLNNIVVANNLFRPETHLISLLKVCQSTCPHIKELTVTEIVTEKQLVLCSSFPGLNIVNLQHSLGSNQELCINEFLKIRGENIHTLSLLSFSMNVEVLLNNCPNLKCLTLDYPSFKSVPLISPESNLSLIHLRVFNLHNFLVAEDSEENNKSLACLIALSPNLEELNLRRCELSDEITEIILNHHQNLKVLNFSNTPVQAPFLEEILKVHKKLKVLVIENSGISVDEYDDLMDIVDSMEYDVKILWADYAEAIRQLFNTDLNAVFHQMNRHVMKL